MRAYDYIVVGSGSAGSVLAGRLSADANCRVLLLEAGGGDWNPLIRIPLGSGKLVRSRLFSWGYQTEPEPHLEGRRISWPRGKVLGGSSSIHSMIYIRGNRGDYDHWSQLGNRGWSHAEVLPYFRRAEGHESRDDAFHGREGPLKVARGKSDNPLYDAFVEAGIEAGHAGTEDFNGAAQEGFGRYDFTIRDGRRCSAADAYLKPVRNRPNLEIATKAQATRVLFEGRRAVGVEYLRRGRRLEARAEAEVLLAGGTLNSPQLLLLSGIGEAEALAEHGIDCRHHLPGVGRNLQDHIDVPVQHLCTQPITLYSQIRADRIALSMLRAQFFKSGFATTFPVEGGTFLKTRPELEMPDVQCHLLGGLATARIRWPLLSALTAGPLDHDGFTCRICVLRPESRGQVGLRSADPLAPVRIQANYLASDNDVATLRRAVAMVREIMAQKAFDPFRGPELQPGPERQSDADLDAWIHAVAETIYHPVGTCRMGQDEMAVVDDSLRVRGLEGLRVVDASVMPSLIGGNTSAPTIMIAEKAADMIRGLAPLASAADAVHPAA